MQQSSTLAHRRNENSPSLSTGLDISYERLSTSSIDEKYRDNSPPSPMSISTKVSRYFNRHRPLAILVILLLFLTALFLLRNLFLAVSSSEHEFQGSLGLPRSVQDNQEYTFAIVFDAGSTGTRIHVYRFIDSDAQTGQKDDSQASKPDNSQALDEKAGTVDPKKEKAKRKKQVNPQNLRLIDELFEEIKPGFSGYAPDAYRAAHSIDSLLLKAMHLIPRSQWADTPVALYATAGLRLLSENVSNAILHDTRTVLANSPFMLCSDCVKILEGLYEGVFAWYSVNQLLGLHAPLETLHERSVGTIDLGGGSVQVTFHPKSAPSSGPETTGIKYYQEMDAHLFGSPLSLYSRSYLELGLMAARAAVLESTGVEGAVTSVCVHEQYTGVRFKFGDRSFLISGQSVSDAIAKGAKPITETVATPTRYELCYAKVKAMLSKFTFDRPREFHTRNFYIFSYFYDRAVDTQLIEFNEGGTVHAQQFTEMALKMCNLPSIQNPMGAQGVQSVPAALPYLCLDLTYISTLLMDGFQFDKDTSFVLRKKIQGIEVSWTLGASFPLLSAANDQPENLGEGKSAPHAADARELKHT